nr:MAG TPA: hypothetical protein [Caudoviricetes sp.]
MTVCDSFVTKCHTDFSLQLQGKVGVVTNVTVFFNIYIR